MTSALHAFPTVGGQTLRALRRYPSRVAFSWLHLLVLARGCHAMPSNPYPLMRVKRTAAAPTTWLQSAFETIVASPQTAALLTSLPDLDETAAGFRSGVPVVNANVPMAASVGSVHPEPRDRCLAELRTQLWHLIRKVRDTFGQSGSKSSIW